METPNDKVSHTLSILCNVFAYAEHRDKLHGTLETFKKMDERIRRKLFITMF